MTTKKTKKAHVMKTAQKSTLAMSRKSRNSPYKAAGAHKKSIRNRGVQAAYSLDRKSLKINLSHLVTHYSVGGKVRAYEILAERLSKLAGLQNGHSWSWNYIACIHSGSIEPSKKFIRALALLLQDLSPRQKQWFYFVRRGSVAAVYDRSILAETLRGRFKEWGYRPTTFTRYMKARRTI